MNVNNSPKIFVVDDEETIHDLIALIFEEEDYQITSVSNAENLIEKISNEQPNIILLDIHLLDGDGRDLCNMIKASSKTAHIPVLLLSALNFDGLDLSCQPDGIIEKPFDMMNIIQKVNQLLKTNRV
ncbi:response regulator [Pedobacter endophyticus]|uniref:Response regulator n=1 Tax=Pedobacter endophyticus TaxID=2789740 RepID=A0A7S9L2N0_9SPHI|nr:response regulator [Pedobacter endophyticus]QPH41379.1 response regulator [Pedobacter endophyticus]